jgi:two-component system response regulator ResD
MPKVLIVEDDQFIREMYAMILTKAGYDVTEAQDGAAGLVVAKHGGYDCILLDLMMPQMDGLTFLKELKKTPPPKENGDEATELGASDFFVKADLDPKEIVALVDKATKK